LVEAEACRPPPAPYGSSSVIWRLLFGRGPAGASAAAAGDGAGVAFESSSEGAVGVDAPLDAPLRPRPLRWMATVGVAAGTLLVSGGEFATGVL